VGLKLNGTYQLLAYGDDMNLLGDNIDTIKKITETLIHAPKDINLEVIIEKTKCMSVSRHQSAGQNRDMKIAITYFENASQCRYLWTVGTNQNLTEDEIKMRFILVMIATIHSWIFCHVVCCREKYKLEYERAEYCLWFCIGVKLILWHWRKI
jgi:hypothetical protein